MKRILALLVTVLALAGCMPNQPLYNVDDHPIPVAARQLPVDRIGALIVEAGQKRNWTFEQAGTGHLVATQTQPKYTAVVDIFFDQQGYKIVKKSTTGFSDQNGWISRRYNNWIHYLEGDIEERLSNASP
ncbi:MAG TPA: hypothetical protein VHA10_13700 [Hypericibacter adhaerens]|jgi:hypothetical protein|uniref:hypothetical protein n=1 Tax=Hypericibacter adhaerens TaxID=2602016 RepID=UPI002D14B781|nr:hypothetical protein [Hypericibacter adhaerens]HWA44261.1 hypothetical protein [Hypericibacter adhaerens]